MCQVHVECLRLEPRFRVIRRRTIALRRAVCLLSRLRHSSSLWWRSRLLLLVLLMVLLPLLLLLLALRRLYYLPIVPVSAVVIRIAPGE